MDELQVRIILAHSPQAKGRVERRHGVFQDRLIKALRLAGISNLESANRFLEEQFLPDLQQRFVVPARSQADLHRRVPRGVRLERVLAFQATRMVQNDWTVQWRGRWLQIVENERSAGLAKKRVLVVERLDGGLELIHRERALTYKELPARPPREPRQSTGPTGVGRVGQKPPADHPWRGRSATASPGPCSPGSASPEVPPALRLASRGRAKNKKELIPT